MQSKNPSKDIRPARLMRWPEVQSLVGICRSHAHQLVEKGQFPQPRKLVPGGRASAWVESEIHEWIEQRIASSSPPSEAVRQPRGCDE